MQASSAYDFEHFADKIEKRTAIIVKEIEKETSEYLLQKENETAQSITLWLKQAQDAWDEERDRKKKTNHHKIETQVQVEWSAFIKERRLILRRTLRIQLEEIFSSLCECFISTIMHKYESGTFTMRKRFNPSVNKEGFMVQSSEKEEIIFTRENLFIEYSVERILEELEDELTSHFHMEDEKWQL